MEEMQWDSEINEGDQSYTVLEPGVYDFQISNFERSRHPGSANLPACNMALLHIKLYNEHVSTTVQHRLFLHTKTEWVLCQFFASIGQRQSGQKIKMDWYSVKGAKGKCRTDIEEYKGNQYTKIVEFLPFEKDDNIPF